MANSKLGFKTLLQVGVAELVKGSFLFGAAGTWRWWQGWAFIFSDVFFGVLATTTLAQNPALLEERKTAARKAKAWDKVLVPLVLVFLPTLLFVLAGLDRRRHWTGSLTGFESVLGLLAVVVSGALFFWAQKSNAFFSSFARIQAERGHRVVSEGPYQVVRHPAYLGLIIGSLGLPILLGSLPALGVGGLIGLLLLVRTGLEDRMLRNELKDYQSYAARVRYKLLPYVW